MTHKAVPRRGRFSSPGAAALRGLAQRLAALWSVRGDVEVGDGFRLGQASVIWSAHGLRIGRHVSVGRFCTIEACGRIGDYVLIAAHVGIVGRRDHSTNALGEPIRFSDWVGDRKCIPDDMVDIGDDVWIGYGATILSGTNIGAGSIIAAGSVVTKDVAQGTIVAGNPARFVGHRFRGEDQLRQHLEALRSRSA